MAKEAIKSMLKPFAQLLSSFLQTTSSIASMGSLATPLYPLCSSGFSKLSVFRASLIKEDVGG